MKLLDQHGRVFQNIKVRLVLLFFPLMFLLLSNVYKGENITNLILEPQFVYFNTLAILVQISLESCLDNFYHIYWNTNM